ncbi:MAG: hypothetical protein DA405_09000 [Bacteroidetes bacterium]|nr:MAG: hypothetical protein DA405_09000 [Bacteroidota bacterium]
MIHQFSKALLSFIVAFLAFQLNAQKTDFETLVQIPESDRTFNKVLNIYDLKESYAVWNSRKRLKEELFFIDKKTGAVLNRASIEDLAVAYPIGIGVLNNQLVLLGLDPKEDKLFGSNKGFKGNPLFYVSFNAKGEKISSGSLFKEADTKDYLRQSATAYFNPTGEFLVISSSIPGDNRNVYTSVFDAELNFLGEGYDAFDDQEEANLAIMFHAYNTRVVDEEGNIFSLSKDGHSIQISERVNNYSTIKINVSEDLIALGESIGRIQIDQLNQDTILVTGLVLKKGNAEFNGQGYYFGDFRFYELLGQYNMLINSFTQELISEDVVYFTAAEKQGWPQSFTAAHESVESVSQHFDKRVFPLEKGDYITIIEHRNLTTGVFIRDFLIVSRHRANGDIVWTKTVDKFQGTPADPAYSFHYLFSGYGSVICDNQLKLIFNQRKGDRQDDSIPKILLVAKNNLKKSEQKIISLNLKTGEVLSKEISNYNETAPRFLKGEFSEDRYPNGPYMIMRDFELDRDVVVKIKE